MVALVLGAGVLAGCGSSGLSDSERLAAKLEQRAKRKGFDRRQVEIFVLASEFCGSQPKSEFGDASIDRLPANPSDQAVARAYSQEWPRHVKQAVFEGCIDGLARVPARPPPSSPAGRALWGRNFTVTSVDGLQGGAEPPIDRPTNIQLGFSAQGEHAIGWSGICNSHSGHVRITATSLEVERVGGTLIGCGDEREAEDEWLFRFMDSKPEWRLADTRLTLIADDVRIELEALRGGNP
jgi:heat shock protein HslJ